MKGYKLDCCLSSKDTHVLSCSEDGHVYCWDLVEVSNKTSFFSDLSTTTQTQLLYLLLPVGVVVLKAACGESGRPVVVLPSHWGLSPHVHGGPCPGVGSRATGDGEWLQVEFRLGADIHCEWTVTATLVSCIYVRVCVCECKAIVSVYFFTVLCKQEMMKIFLIVY